MMFALVDCNNFFVSCERVFNPKLRNVPVIVLSNNDGCAIARSNEAKQLGVAMGSPLFKIKHLVDKHKIVVLSSNFPVYGNLSARIMHIIRSYAPEVEVYSVDEAFINLRGITNKEFFCQQLVKIIDSYTGVPVSIGIGKTRTLAKAANHIAKKRSIAGRVFCLDSMQELQKIDVGDIWGIGRRLEKRLQSLGVYTAAELSSLSDATIRQVFNVVVLRTVRELRGIPCIELQDQTVNKGQIMVSRSFGMRIKDLSAMQEAVSTYASTACIKLRKQRLVAGGMYVFLNTGLHGDDVYKNSLYVAFESVTSDTRIIISHAKQLLQKLFRVGYAYKKVGVILTELSPGDTMQFDIFGHGNHLHSEKLMQTVDDINKLLGRDTIQFAAAGFAKEWRMRSNNRTPNYTGEWQHIPTVILGDLTVVR